MMYRFLWSWLLGLALATAARAQTPCTLSPPRGCTFDIFALENGTSTAALCVGQPVSFELCQGAGLTIRYEVVTGNVANLAPCVFTQPSTFVYTPTAAGTITMFALANDSNNAFVYRRTFQVFDRPTPNFDLTPCSGSNVLVTLLPGTSYDQYFVQAGTNPEQPAFQNNQTTFTLPANGFTSVTVRGSYAAKPSCGGSQTKTFAPLGTAPAPLLPRLVQAVPRTGSPATLTFGNVQAPYRYTVLNDNGSGAPTTVGTLAPPTATLALPGGAAGCYQLRRADACEVDVAFSAPLCALALSVTPLAGRNQLAFSYPGAASFRVERNGTLLAVPLAGTATAYDDADNIICGQTYRYRITALLPGGAESTSNEVSVEAVLGPAPAAPGLVASFTLQNTIALTPLLPAGIPTGSTLRYRKTAGSAPAVDFATAGSARVVGDSTALEDLLAAPPCYTVRFVDVCNSSSAASPASCPAILSATPTDAEGRNIALAWTPFTGPGTGFSYTLQQLDAEGRVLRSPPATATDQPADDRQVLRYRLQVSGGGLPSGTFSYSNVARVVRRPRVQIPTAFTPNGDGLNDVLEVKGRFLQNYTFVVVDRNGQEVFRGTRREETWDGRINGRAPVNGSYVWRLRLNDEEGKPVSETGTVTILK